MSYHNVFKVHYKNDRRPDIVTCDQPFETARDAMNNGRIMDMQQLESKFDVLKADYVDAEYLEE